MPKPHKKVEDEREYERYCQILQKQFGNSAAAEKADDPSHAIQSFAVDEHNVKRQAVRLLQKG